MKNRTTMIVALALFALVAATVPAGAVKPDRPPKPPKAVRIAVSLDANPMWVHEGRDLISYTVTLENKTSNEIENVAVKLTTTDLTEYPLPVDDWDFPVGAAPVWFRRTAASG